MTDAPSDRKRLEQEAGEGTRTLDLRLGKPTLYQLSYARAPNDSSGALKEPSQDARMLAA